MTVDNHCKPKSEKEKEDLEGLQIFDYNNKMVRTIARNNEYWCVLKDVCNVLKISNTTMMAKRLADDEVTKLDLGGNVGLTNIINESGLYSVILRNNEIAQLGS